MSSNAHEFKKSTVLTLPDSGLEVELRKPNIKRLVLHSPKGKVPEFLTSLVLSGLNGDGGKNPLTNLSELSDDKKLEALAGLDDFTALVVEASLINPRISQSEVPDYGNGEIAYEDLSDTDTAFIAAWGMPKDAQAAQTFSQGQSSSMESVSDVQAVQPAPVELPEVVG